MAGLSLSSATPARAQGQPAAVPGRAAAPAAPAAAVAPASPAPPAPAPEAPAPPVNPALAALAASSDTNPMPVPTDLTQAHAGGITADQVAVRAAATSWSAKANEEALRGAAARVDEAWAAFLPRLSGLARYTRLSHISPPSLGNLWAPPPSQAPFSAATGFTAPSTTGPVNEFTAVPLVIQPILDNWLLQATINVPISDYFLRLDQSYSSATHSRDAANWDIAGARATAASNGRVAYYSWLRARGGVIVAVQALNDQRTHLRDGRNQFAVGNASKADVLRAETAVSSAELALVQAQNLASLTEKQLRVALHIGDDVPMLPGEDLDAALPAEEGNLQELLRTAIGARAEVKSADANARSARQQAAAAGSTRWPSLSAFGDAIAESPNPRLFVPVQKLFPSWDVGAQLTWAPNDVLTANGQVAEAESRAAATEANRNVVIDGVEVEVTQYWQNVRQADFAIEAGGHELASAQEAYRVARELFNNGRGTSTTLTDAETDLTRARLDLLNAKADARIARVQLEHAIGRDLKAPDASR